MKNAGDYCARCGHTRQVHAYDMTTGTMASNFCWVSGCICTGFVESVADELLNAVKDSRDTLQTDLFNKGKQ